MPTSHGNEQVQAPLSQGRETRSEVRRGPEVENDSVAAHANLVATSQGRAAIASRVAARLMQALLTTDSVVPIGGGITPLYYRWGLLSFLAGRSVAITVAKRAHCEVGATYCKGENCTNRGRKQ